MQTGRLKARMGQTVLPTATQTMSQTVTQTARLKTTLETGIMMEARTRMKMMWIREGRKIKKVFWGGFGHLDMTTVFLDRLDENWLRNCSANGHMCDVHVVCAAAA